MFDKFKQTRKIRKLAIEKIDSEILAEDYEVEVIDKDGNRTVETKKNHSTHIAELMDLRRKVKFEGINTSDVLKVVANVTVVTILVGVEMSHVLSQKGSRFIQVL